MLHDVRLRQKDGPLSLEREIKLRFADPAAARAALIEAGALPLRARRLQHDCLLDTADGQLRGRRSIVRVRNEDGRSFLTFKGPPQPSAMKLREEVEVGVASAETALALLNRLGFEVGFRCEKYREEFTLGQTIAAVDETVIGTFVEIEGAEQAIVEAARLLGFGPGDYIVDSYRGLFVRDREQRGLAITDMLFGRD
jgi:adenylate cyclase, class 2